jgi:Tol biopolymer transport system component
LGSVPEADDVRVALHVAHVFRNPVFLPLPLLLRLTEGSETDSSPDWSPNGTEIAFVRNSEIYKMNTDGSGVTRLTHNAESEGSPAWSPDGRQIAFVRISAAGKLGIYIMYSDGSNPTLVKEFEATSTVSALDW